MSLDRLAKAELVAEAALDRKALDLVALDARGIASFADTFVLVAGGGTAQLAVDAGGRYSLHYRQPPRGR